MMVSIFNRAEGLKPTRVKDAYLMRLEEIAKDSGPGWENVSTQLSEDACTERRRMTPNNHNSHPIKQISLAETIEAISSDAEEFPRNGIRVSTATGQVVPWQQLAEQVAPKFSEALLGAAEAIYGMIIHERAARERAIRSAVDVSDRLDSLSRDLQSIRAMVNSLAESQLAHAAKVTELETSIENKVFVALERGLKCLDDGMRERQEVADGRLASVSEEVSRVGQRLEVHANTIRTLAEAMQSQIERREEFKTGLEKLAEVAGLPVTLTPLPDEL
jgi:hypothetical protein